MLLPFFITLKGHLLCLVSGLRKNWKDLDHENQMAHRR